MNYSKSSNITHNWVTLLVPFCNSYSRDYSATDISRMTGIKRIKESCEKNKNGVEFKLAEKDFFVIIKSEKRQSLIANYIKNFKNAKRED